MEVNEVITNLNPLEYDIYFYLIQNKNMVISMKLKDLANQLHVSTAMITRVCQKLGFEGFGEYKAYLKLEEHEQVNTNTFQLEHIFNFFYSVDNEMFYQEIQEAVALIKEARDVIFYGIGLSGILAQYGHGLFNRKGIRSLYIEDFSMRLDFYEKAIICHRAFPVHDTVVAADGGVCGVSDAPRGSAADGRRPAPDCGNPAPALAG